MLTSLPNGDEAIITGLIFARGFSIAPLRVKYDPQLVVNQVKREYVTKSEKNI